ncbi:uncharacterized protein LOC125802967 isoform X1 [Astyanax mexicanus]|uniref:uncharacterized protein LOC125802967 isoform X1 n=1 Tax=Astyanax mexicanus TaxID=7994 RepID=UPI0020CB3473|nr:uncharacterized protein LOC125802967 isoform X1 [Astyanax mexicanus]
MWGFWILLFAASLTESYADVNVVYGQQLSINITAMAERLEFISVDKSKEYTIWSSLNGPKKGKVIQWSGGKHFIINSASFDDEGNYTEVSNYQTFVTKVKVLTSTETQRCEAGETLTISLDGLMEEGASLRFSRGAEEIMLVHQGLLMMSVPTFKDRIKVTSSSIQVLSVQGSDAGKYTLLDSKGRVVKISTLQVTNTCVVDVDVQYGRQLSIKLLTQVTSMGLKPVDQSQNYVIWSSTVRPTRGKVVGSGKDRRFIINPANFEDQGDYTQRNTENKGICVSKVKVVPSTDTKKREVGKTLTIPLDVIKKNEASLQFYNGAVTILLVKNGSSVRNLGDLSKQIKVTDSSIQVLNVQRADKGNYRLLDSKNRVVKITTLEVINPCADEVDVKYGQQLRIKILVQIKSLGFMSENKLQNNTIWPQSAQSSRGSMEGDMKHFTINSVNFEDQGVYMQWDNQRNMICATNVTVSTFTKTEKCEAGNSLTISLSDMKKNEASLHFSNKEHLDLMLVRRGVPQRNSSDFYDRISVTSSSIQVLKISESDVGQYTLFDGNDRKAKIITLELTKPVNWMAICGFGVVVVVLGLLAGGIYRCCCRTQSEANVSNRMI